MDRVLKKRVCQQRYYRKKRELIQEKAKVYRANLTPEQRQQKLARGLKYYYKHQGEISNKRLLRRLQRTEEEKERDHQRRRESAHRRPAEENRAFYRHYYKNNQEHILLRQRKGRLAEGHATLSSPSPTGAGVQPTPYCKRRDKLLLDGRYEVWRREQMRKGRERFKRLSPTEQQRVRRRNSMYTCRWREKKRQDGTWEEYEQRTRERRLAKRARMTPEEVLAHSRLRYSKQKVVKRRWLKEQLKRPFPLEPMPWQYAEWSVPVDLTQEEPIEHLNTIVDSL